jgi:hypothetical protein
MLDAVQGVASDRKLRLFAISAFRYFFAGFGDPAFRKIPDAEEAFVEGALSAEGLRLACVDARGGADIQNLPFLIDPFGHAQSLAITFPQISEGMQAPRPPIRAAYAGLLRDIFGDPFRPAWVDLRWRTADAFGLALSAYDSCDFSTLPILADALEDAGCDDPAVLGHLRGGGPHFRGCHVLDLVLAKE